MRKILYTGLNPISCKNNKGEIYHIPFIKIIPRPFEDPLLQSLFQKFDLFTHVIITSKSTVKILANYLSKLNLSENWKQKIHFSVGQVTTHHLEKQGIKKIITAQIETAEGLIQELKKPLNAYFFYPHSSLSRPLLLNHLKKSFFDFEAYPLYDTQPCVPENLDITPFDEIIFTSPSTVDAYFSYFHSFQKEKIFSCIGPVTQARFQLLNNLS